MKTKITKKRLGELVEIYNQKHKHVASGDLARFLNSQEKTGYCDRAIYDRLREIRNEKVIPKLEPINLSKEEPILNPSQADKIGFNKGYIKELIVKSDTNLQTLLLSIIKEKFPEVLDKAKKELLPDNLKNLEYISLTINKDYFTLSF